MSLSEIMTIYNMLFLLPFSFALFNWCYKSLLTSIVFVYCLYFNVTNIMWVQLAEEQTPIDTQYR